MAGGLILPTPPKLKEKFNFDDYLEPDPPQVKEFNLEPDPPQVKEFNFDDYLEPDPLQDAIERGARTPQRGGLGRYAPYAGAAVKTKEILDFHSAASRYEEGDRSPEIINELGYYLGQQQNRQNQTWYEWGFDIAKEMPAFGIELMTSGVGFAFGKKVALGALGKVSQKWIGKIAANSVGLAAMTVMNPQLVVHGAAARMVDEYQLGRNVRNELIFSFANEDDDFLESLPAAFLSSMGQIGTEIYIGKALGKVWGSVAKWKGFQDFMERIPLKTKIVGLKTGFTRRAMEMGLTDSKMMKSTAEALKKAHWHGMPIEIIEERVADGLEGVANVVSPEGGFQPYEWPSWKQIMAEGLGFAVPGFARAMISSGTAAGRHMLSDTLWMADSTEGRQAAAERLRAQVDLPEAVQQLMGRAASEQDKLGERNPKNWLLAEHIYEYMPKLAKEISNVELQEDGTVSRNKIQEIDDKLLSQFQNKDDRTALRNYFNARFEADAYMASAHDRSGEPWLWSVEGHRQEKRPLLRRDIDAFPVDTEGWSQGKEAFVAELEEKFELSNDEAVAVGELLDARAEALGQTTDEYVAKLQLEKGGESGEGALFAGSVRSLLDPQTKTPAFKRWFGKSKVVDEAGEPLVVYHGTPFGGFGERAERINKIRESLIKERDKLMAEGRKNSDIVNEWRREVFDRDGNMAEFSDEFQAIKSLAREGAIHPDLPTPPTAEQGGDVFRYIGTNDRGYMGAGFYFTANKAYAQKWADSAGRAPSQGEQRQPKVYATYLSLENPFYKGKTELPDGWAKVYDEKYEYFKPIGRGADPDAYSMASSKAETAAYRHFGFDGVIGDPKTGDGIEYLVFDSKQIKSSIGNRGTFDPNDPNILFQSKSAQKVREVRRSLKKEIAQHLTDEEIKSIGSGASSLNAVERWWKDLGARSESDLEAASKGGFAALGWYRKTAKALQAVFGSDASRFGAVLASLSPQQGVKENLVMAIKVWGAWLEAGRPVHGDFVSIKRKDGTFLEAELDGEYELSLFMDISSLNVRIATLKRKLDLNKAKKLETELEAAQELQAENSIIYNIVREIGGVWNFDGRMKNVILSLTELDADNIRLGNDPLKVESFRRNVNGDLNASTNDVWMALIADFGQKQIFGGRLGYFAYTAKVRKVAKKLGIEPAEVQETAWSFIKTLAALRAGGTSAAKALALITDEHIMMSPSFAQLFEDPDVQKSLDQLFPEGIPELGADADRDRGRDTGGSQERLSEVKKDTPRVLRRIAERTQDEPKGGAVDAGIASVGKLYQTPFYSKLAREIDGLKQEKLSSQQLLGLLKKSGVKDDEIEWVELREWLGDRKSVTKAELQEFVALNQLEVIETVKGPPPKSDFEVVFGPVNNITGEPVWRAYKNNIEYGTGGSREDALDEAIMRSAQISAEEEEAGLPAAQQTKFGEGDNVLPGGENYREVLLRMPRREAVSFTKDGKNFVGLRTGTGQAIVGDASDEALVYGTAKSFGDDMAGALAFAAEYNRAYPSGVFRGGHFDESNILAHVRINDRVGPNGEKILFIEELQSDWAQAQAKYPPITADERARLNSELSRRKDERAKHNKVVVRVIRDEFGGKTDEFYQRANSNHPERIRRNELDRRVNEIEAKLPKQKPLTPFPFNKFEPFAMKRMIRWAAENGYDTLAWTTGAQQVDRYDLSKQVDEIRWQKTDINGEEDAVLLTMKDSDGRTHEPQLIPTKELDRHIGKEMAAKIDAEPVAEGIYYRQRMGVFRGLRMDLKVGGEGLKYFYDKKLPNVVNKLTKKYGAKVGEIAIARGFGGAPRTMLGLIRGGFEIVDTGGDPTTIGVGDTVDEAIRMANDEMGGDRVDANNLPDNWDVIQRPGEDFSFTAHGIKITPQLRRTALEQGFPVFQGEKASVQFIEDGRAIIRALESPDLSSVIHELFHVFRRELSDADLAIAAKWAGAAGPNSWSVEAEEKFARAGERYLTEGKSPTKALERVFEQFKQWMMKIYSQILGSDIDIKISPEMKNLFDRLFVPAGGQTSAEAEAEAAEAAEAAGVEPTSVFSPKGKLVLQHVDFSLLTIKQAQEMLTKMGVPFSKWRRKAYYMDLLDEFVGEDKAGSEGSGDYSYSSVSHKGEDSGSNEASKESKGETEGVNLGSRPLSGVPMPELVRLANELSGEVPKVRKMKSALGKFISKNMEIILNPSLAKNSKTLAAVLAHEIGHLVDYLSDFTMLRGNILGRIASLRGYIKGFMESYPGAKGPLSEEDKTRLRKEAERLASENAEELIDEEIRTEFPIVPEDILAIWNSLNADLLPENLVDYVKGLNTAEKKSIIVAAMKGVVAEELQRFKKIVIETTGKKIRSKTSKNATDKAILEKYHELLAEELKKRALYSNQEIREELIALTKWWSSDFEDGSKSYQKYRTSSVELYAEALSVFLNSPGDLQERAPEFWRGFMSYIERKPEFLKEYLEFQDFLSGNPEGIGKRRRAFIQAMFKRGADKVHASVEADRAANMSITETIQQVLFQWATYGLDKSHPIKKRQRALEKEGVKFGEDFNPIYEMDELFSMENEEYSFLHTVDEDIYAPLLNAGISKEYIGEYLFLRRIVNERNEIINPLGYTPEEADKQMDSLREELGEDGFAFLEETIQKWHKEILFPYIEKAVKWGVYSEKNFEELIKPNLGNYATFAVIHYLDSKIGAGIYEQTGTLQEVANPWMATHMKMISLIRLTEINKAKTQIRRFLQESFPEDIKFVEVPYGKDRPSRQAATGNEYLQFLEDGKMVFYEVPAPIAKAFQQHDIGGLKSLFRILQTPTYMVFHPLYVKFAPLFLAANPFRDIRRTHQLLGALTATRYKGNKDKAISLGELLKAIWEAKGEAWQRAKGIDSDTINEMIKDRALSKPYQDLNQHLEEISPSKIPGEQEGGWVKKMVGSKRAGIRWLGKSLDLLDRIGVFQETSTKLAAYNLLGERGITGRERSSIIRKYAGTPDFKQHGLATRVSNALWMYSKVRFNAAQSEIDVAFSKDTRAAYWWRRMVWTIMPTTIARAATYGYFGVVLKNVFAKIPDYFMDVYDVIPLPFGDPDDEEQDQPFLTLPKDDFGILVSALWGNALDEMNESDRNQFFKDALKNTISQFLPAQSPVLDILDKWRRYGLGENPNDRRGRPIIPAKEWKAKSESWADESKMVAWTIKKFGVAGATISGLTRLASSPPATADEWTEAIVQGTLRATGAARIVRFSKRGLDEKDREDLEYADSLSALESLGIPRRVREATVERDKLNRLNTIKELNEKRQEQRLLLNAWFEYHYKPLAKLVESDADASTKEIEASLEYLESPSERMKLKLIEAITSPKFNRPEGKITTTLDNRTKSPHYRILKEFTYREMAKMAHKESARNAVADNARRTKLSKLFPKYSSNIKSSYKKRMRLLFLLFHR